MKDLAKHLFLLLIIIIMIIGVYMTYKSPAFKLSNFANIEHFTTSPLYPEPINFKVVEINKDGIIVEFNPPPMPTNADGTMPSSIPQLLKYCIIIASMDDKGAIVNGQRMFLQPSNSCTSPDITNVALPESQRFVCNYKIPIIPDDNEVSFKAGLMAIYNSGNSNVINPSNISIFKLGLTLSDNINIYNEGVSAIKTKQKLTESIFKPDNVIGAADGHFEMIRQSLGGYPDNLFINQEIDQHTLSDSINKQLSLGIIDVNVGNYS